MISLDSGVRYLACDVLVGKADDQPVLGGIVLVFVLNNQLLAGEVISLGFSPPPELDLKPLEVGLILDNFDKPHCNFLRDFLHSIYDSFGYEIGRAHV